MSLTARYLSVPVRTVVVSGALWANNTVEGQKINIIINGK